MMILLKKCFCYGKLLKQLFITSLISCSFLLVNSFVSASDGYVPFGNTLNFGGNNCNFGNNLSFNCQKGGITLSNFLDNYMSSLFWLNDGIGFYYSPNPNNLDKTVRQGYINTGFYVCYGDTQTIIDNNWILSCPSSSSYCVNGFTPSGFMDYNSLVSLLTSKVPLYAYNPDGSNGVLYSLLYDDFYFIVYNSSSNYNVCGTFKNGVVEENVGITGNSLSNFTYGNNVLYSPLGSSFSGNSSITGNLVSFSPCMTLGEILSLRPQYYTGLCYSSDIIYSGNSFISVVPKSIFELFPTYNDFNSYMNLFQNYCNNSVVSPGQCSLAFSGLDDIYSLVSKIPTNVKREDLYNYCDLALNYDSNISSCVASGGFNALNPWTDLSNNDFFNGFDSNINLNVPASGSALDIIWNLNHSGSMSDILNNPDSVFNSVDDMWNIFPNHGIKDGIVGLLPQYIILGFFGILFLYFLRR